MEYMSTQTFSESTRESAVKIVQRAYADGRINEPELEHRLSLIFEATSYPQLRLALADLPAPTPVQVPSAFRTATPTAARSSFDMASLVHFSGLVSGAHRSWGGLAGHQGESFAEPRDSQGAELPAPRHGRVHRQRSARPDRAEVPHTAMAHHVGVSDDHQHCESQPRRRLAEPADADHRIPSSGRFQSLILTPLRAVESGHCPPGPEAARRGSPQFSAASNAWASDSSPPKRCPGSHIGLARCPPGHCSICPAIKSVSCFSPETSPWPLNTVSLAGFREFSWVLETFSLILMKMTTSCEIRSTHMWRTKLLA